MPANQIVAPTTDAVEVSSGETKPMLEASLYIVFCALTGFCGMGRRMGFFGTFLLALVTTPLVVLPVLLLTGPARNVEWRRRL
jgi:hypothetical protein